MDTLIFFIIFLILLTPVLYIYNIKQKKARIQERQKNEEKERIYQNTIDTHKIEINNLIESIKTSKDVNEQINIIKENEDLTSVLEQRLEEEEPNIYFKINKKIILTQLGAASLQTLLALLIVTVVGLALKGSFSRFYDTIVLLMGITVIRTVFIAIKYARVLFKKPKTL